LKHNDIHPLLKPHQVAPRAGAWIETSRRRVLSGIGRSPPARGRGLKLTLPLEPVVKFLSPPARGRGLKL